MSSLPGFPSCNPHGDPPIFGDCWYNCTSEDISQEDKKHRLRKVYVLFSYRKLTSFPSLFSKILQNIENVFK